jgi:hypothetical protein
MIRGGTLKPGFQAILADQQHADSPSEPRECVHIERKIFSVSDQ